jgi:hypothetical protein
MPGIPGMSGMGAAIGIEQQLAAFEQQPPPQAVATFPQHNRPQQLRTEVATNFIIGASPKREEEIRDSACEHTGQANGKQANAETC